jgi:hypothetical protein
MTNMSNKTLSMLGLAMLFTISTLAAAPEVKKTGKNAKTTQKNQKKTVKLEKNKPARRARTEATPEAKKAFAAAAFFKAPQLPLRYQPQLFPTQKHPIVFNAPRLAEQYTQPTIFAYNTTTQKFESRPIKDLALQKRV